MINEIPDGWCAYHNEVEPYNVDSITCGECWHTFYTEQDLLDAHNDWGRHVHYLETDVNKVYVCPVCIHDF